MLLFLFVLLIVVWVVTDERDVVFVVAKARNGTNGTPRMLLLSIIYIYIETTQQHQWDHNMAESVTGSLVFPKSGRPLQIYIDLYYIIMKNIVCCYMFPTLL